MNLPDPYRLLTAALLLAFALPGAQELSPVPLQGPTMKNSEGSSHISGQIESKNVPLLTLPEDTTLQEFAASADLSAYALVYTRMKVKAHMEGKHKKLQSNATVVHNGTVVGTYPDVIPFSLRMSPDGASVAFGVVQWKTWNLPIYWFVRDGDRFESTGHYTEDVEFRNLAVPWFSPDGGRVAYLIAVKNKRRVMVDEKSVFVSQHARLENPWSPDGQQLALITLKNGQERLVVDGASAAAAGSIRLVEAPDTYVAQDEEGATFFIEGSACVTGREFHSVAASPSGGRFALSMSDHDGNLKVLHLEAPCKTLETWHGGSWKAVEILTLSPDGKRVFFVARRADGSAETSMPEKTMWACGKDVVYKSVTMAADPDGTAWIVAHQNKHGLCLNGKLLGTWSRIETPLAFPGNGKGLRFYAWKNRGLYLEKTAPLK